MRNIGYREIFGVDAMNLKRLNDTLRALWDKVMGGIEGRDLREGAIASGEPTAHFHGAGDVNSGRLGLSRLPSSPEANRVLRAGEAGGDPEYSPVDLGSDVGGTLAKAFGGLGADVSGRAAMMAATGIYLDMGTVAATAAGAAVNFSTAFPSMPRVVATQTGVASATTLFVEGTTAAGTTIRAASGSVWVNWIAALIV